MSTRFAIGGIAAIAAATIAAGRLAERRPATFTLPPSAGAVTITARDFHFVAPDTIAAGVTRFTLLNEGTEPHHVQIVRIADGYDAGDVIELLARRELELPGWLTFVGGPGTALTSGTIEAVLDLPPGRYALLCFVTSSDHVRHGAKGMVRALTVVAGRGARTPRPRADAQMALRDYSFSLSTPIRPGRRTIEVENLADQPHEVAIVKLAPGKTGDDVLAWAKTRHGPPPGSPIGGAMALSRGEVNWVTAEFERGNYFLLCYVPDAEDGKPHIAHGMTRTITVE